MQKLMDTDVLFLIGRLPKDVFALVKKYNLIVAGGFVRSTISATVLVTTSTTGALVHVTSFL